MGSRRDAGLELVAVEEQFEGWRRRRKRGARIPEELWSGAVAVARELGVSKTALSLGLDYYALKRRLEEAEAVVDAEFVEIPLGTMLGGVERSECELELEDESGRRLRIVLKGAATANASAVARALWSKRR